MGWLILKKKRYVKKKKEPIKNVYVTCPYCNVVNTIPENAGVGVLCSYCGNTWYTSGVEVFDKNSSKYYSELAKENRREFNSRNQED